MTRIHVLALAGVTLMIAAGAAQLLPSSAGTARAATQNVAVQNNHYTPPAITVNVGDTVQWDWPAPPNTTQHTVTSDSPSTELDSGAPQTTGTYSHTFGAAGTYDYHCEVHGSAMSGTVTVQEEGAPTATNTAPAATNTASATSIPARTRTATPVSTDTATAISTPIITPTHAPGLAPTAPPATAPSNASGGAAGAGALPRTGSGPDRGVSLAWLTVALAVAGLAAIAAAGVIRFRTQK